MAASDPNERRYEGIRQAARQATMDFVYNEASQGRAPGVILSGLDLTAIDDRALNAAETQWSRQNFPWNKICGQSRPYIRRFEVAIWIDNALSGLCIGRSSRGDDNVTIHFIERGDWYFGTALKGWIAPIAIDAADNYAYLIGRKRLKLKNPLPGALPVYAALNFKVAETYRGVAYYERRV